MQSPSISPRSRLCRNAALSILALAACAAPVVRAQSLLGSHESLLKQNEEAREHDFTYLRTAADVRDYAQQGVLVRLPGNADYELATDEVSFPYARPEVKLFIERLASQYHESCGELLVVTSLTRPITRQPPNASAISVHPTGMAADLRRSDSPGCRQWLETVLLDLEGKDVIEATREQYPPHYHVAVFPNPYLQYVASGQELPNVQVAKSTGRATSRVRAARAGRRRSGRARTAVAGHHRSGRSGHHRRSHVLRAANRRGSPRHHRVVAARSHRSRRHAQSVHTR